MLDFYMIHEWKKVKFLGLLLQLLIPNIPPSAFNPFLCSTFHDVSIPGIFQVLGFHRGLIPKCGGRAAVRVRFD